ncbi:MAG: TonB-dependent receptor, partial [Candidatus Anammoxibacter sp.]
MITNINTKYCFLVITVLMLCFLKSPFAFSEDALVNVPENVNVSDSTINPSDTYLEDELNWLREENYVTIATKSKLKISKAPSIVTVITAEEIEDMGFRTLPEVLRIVPGFDIIKDAGFGKILSGVRGIRDADNKIKVLIDGHSLNMPYNGGAALFFDDLPLKNVKKIEIIRGPGSALYGANAFLAVINI